jgi:hypothetical protein
MHAGSVFSLGFTVALLVAAGLWATPAAAQWKWKDENGRVTDRPPPRSVPDKDILQRPTTRPAPARVAAAASEPTTAGAGATAAAPRVDRDLEARRRAAEADKATKSRAEEDARAVQRAENCRRARNQLATMESGQRVARLNDKGEREFLDDSQRASEAQRAREAMASECR